MRNRIITIELYYFLLRLDIEEALAEEKKTRDTLNKELEALQKKAKIIDVGVKNAENELEAFQVIYTQGPVHTVRLRNFLSVFYVTRCEQFNRN